MVVAKRRALGGGTVEGLTDRTHANLKGRTTGPTIHDAKAVLRLSQLGRRLPCACLLLDVSKAHRRFKLSRGDWRYAACRLTPREVYVNTTGFYGLASSQWWRAHRARHCIG